MAYPPRKNPTNVPSQAPSRQVPYTPKKQPDLVGKDKLQKRHPPGWGPVDAFVVSSFDSRPLNCSDFLVGGEGSTFDPFGLDIPSFFFEYTPPEGRVAILREWAFDCWLIEASGDPTVSSASTRDGQPRVNISDITLSEFEVQMSFLVAGSEVPEYNNIRYPNAIFGTIGAETFILVGTGDTLRVEAKIFHATEPSFDVDITQFQLYGNLLLATGQNLQYEQATQEPVPVTAQKKGGVSFTANR